MAIVQISRITNRKGLQENLPQLAGAELGWCVDSRRLFIGNGTLEAGAPIIGNTEILTEFSDVTTISRYTYEDVAAGYAAQTGPTAGDPVVRTVQAKLDDFASVRDFGAVGDGVTDDTAAINRALFQLYCRDNNTLVRRSLYFPAGTYRVTDTIIIPTYAKLVGEGADCSIISLQPDDSILPDFVARFGDSLQQTGVNIGAAGAEAPRNIEISSMTFRSTVDTDVFMVEDATQCWFSSVNFQGSVSFSDISADTSAVILANLAAVRFASTSVLVTNQITFDRCKFSGVTYGIDTDQQIASVTVSNSNFNTMIVGIRLGAGAVVNGGATGFRATCNMFDDIYGSGVIYNNVNLNVTAYNIFYNVGNNFTTSPVVPCITFGNNNNVSVADMFERSDAGANISPRISVSNNPSLVGGTQIQLGPYTRENGQSFDCLDNQSSPQAVFSTNANNVRAYRMNYTMIRGVLVRHGVLTVVAENGDDSTIALSYTDDYSETADVGVVLIPSQSGSTVTVNYTSTNTGTPIDLNYSLEYLA
jgi:hypothetical protein